MDARTAAGARVAAGAGVPHATRDPASLTGEFDAMTRRLLAQAGMPLADEALLRARLALRGAARSPGRAVCAAARRHRIVGLGEMHTLRGRALLPALDEAAARGGARILFLEVRTDEQAGLDAFAASGRVADLPASLGGGPEEPLPSDLPYHAMLIAARRLGLRLVAMDHDSSDECERDRYMAEVVRRELSRAAGATAIVVVGQLHLMRRAQPLSEAPLALLLERALGADALWTLGRAVPDPEPGLCLWTLVAAPRVPAVIARGYGPLDRLPSHCASSPLLGADFDALLLVPPLPEELRAWRARGRLFPGDRVPPPEADFRP